MVRSLDRFLQEYIIRKSINYDLYQLLALELDSIEPPEFGRADGGWRDEV